MVQKNNNKMKQTTKTFDAVKEQKNSKRGWYEILADICSRVSRTNLLFYTLVPLITTITLEWIARGSFAGNLHSNGFFQALIRHFPSFAASYILLLLLYIILYKLTTLHSVTIPIIGLAGNIPAVVTYYKLMMRNEPFLPWDLNQVDDLMAISGEVSFVIQPSMICTILIFIALIIVAAFADYKIKHGDKELTRSRLITGVASLLLTVVLTTGVFLSPNVCQAIGINRDMWMQDRYYRNHGVLTGFLTNLQMMQIDKPTGYNAQTIQTLLDSANSGSGGYFANSYGANASTPNQQPDIIYLMAETFWDVTQLDGVTYDQAVVPNYTALKNEAAYGKVLSPSFGGGTCDVEFEALTGFSMEHLPSGSKPFQQYLTQPTASLPNYLLGQGYDTLGIHAYGGRFWNRDKAYPNLGIDEFFSSEDFVNPVRKRGFVSDKSFVERIIEEHATRSRLSQAPVFIHGVSMQNHSTYNRNRYVSNELVNITSAPDSWTDETVGKLEDYSTGVRDMDAALGMLVEYLRTSERETILVFWGDHLNNIADGYSIYEDTGFIEKEDTSNPKLFQTPLLIWSNYDSASIDLGIVSAYNLSPVMMDLYGLEKPAYFGFLMQQFAVMTGRSRGNIANPDGTFSMDMSEEQKLEFYHASLFQYDLMFGNKYVIASDSSYGPSLST